jgi:ABC-type branched-subunit amino acid transport system substrate-binding protein
MSRSLRAVLLALPLVVALAATSTSGAARRHPRKPAHPPRSNATLVAVPRGQAVQIAFAAALDVSEYEPGIANAVRMAVEAQPAVRGFPIQINQVSAACGDPADDVAAATSITANLQNVAVLGQFCSSGFDQALPIYQSAGVVTISGSATNDSLPSFGPTVFDRTTVDDDTFESWYAAVSQLPSDLAWQRAYALEFGVAPSAFADLYYDAASLLIRDLQQVSTVDRGGTLIVNRAGLASAVRSTTGYQGVSCTITLDPSTGNRLDDQAALRRCAGG